MCLCVAASCTLCIECQRLIPSEPGVIPIDMKLKISYYDLEPTDASAKCALNEITYSSNFRGAHITFALNAIYDISLGIEVTQQHFNAAICSHTKSLKLWILHCRLHWPYFHVFHSLFILATAIQCSRTIIFNSIQPM